MVFSWENLWVVEMTFLSETVLCTYIYTVGFNSCYDNN